MENLDNEPVVKFEFLMHSHKEEIDKINQIDDVHNMIFDLRNCIRNSIKHEVPFLGLKVDDSVLDVLTQLNEWFIECKHNYNITLD